VKVTIDRLGHLGDGVAMGPEGAIFVPGMLPGEEVEGTLQGDQLADFRIVTPSINRVKPPCSHAKTCGGCMMQHAADAFVADWKLGIVKGALDRQGLDAVFHPIITSPPKSRRRATIAVRRTKNGALMGFHARASDMVVDVPNCQLLHPDLMATFPALEALVKLGGSRTAEVSMTVTKSLAGPDVMVVGGKELDSNLILELARTAETYGIARLTWNGDTVALRIAPMQRFGRALVSPPPGAAGRRNGRGVCAQNRRSVCWRWHLCPAFGRTRRSACG
jgi:23S rRNA (uracil1939-C5)-methyltransferase